MTGDLAVLLRSSMCDSKIAFADASRFCEVRRTSCSCKPVYKKGRRGVDRHRFDSIHPPSPLLLITPFLFANTNDFILTRFANDLTPILTTMKFTALALTLLSALTLSSAAPLNSEKRDVYSPPVLYPTTGTVWYSGQRHNVTWCVPSLCTRCLPHLTPIFDRL